MGQDKLLDPARSIPETLPVGVVAKDRLALFPREVTW